MTMLSLHQIRNIYNMSNRFTNMPTTKSGTLPVVSGEPELHPVVGGHTDGSPRLLNHHR